MPCSDPTCDICCGEMYDGGEKMVIDANGTQCVEIRKFGRGGVLLAAEDRDKGEGPKVRGELAMTDDVRKHCEFGGLAGPVADTTQRLRTAWDFACEWYRSEQIHRSINSIHGPYLPPDVKSKEFAEFLTDQYRLAMAKGIQIGREWDKYQQKGGE